MNRRAFLVVCITVGVLGVAIGSMTLWGTVASLLP